MSKIKFNNHFENGKPNTMFIIRIDEKHFPFGGSSVAVLENVISETKLTDIKSYLEMEYHYFNKSYEYHNML